MPHLFFARTFGRLFFAADQKTRPSVSTFMGIYPLASTQSKVRGHYQ